MLLSRVHFQFDVIELIKGGSIVENFILKSKSIIDQKLNENIISQMRI